MWSVVLIQRHQGQRPAPGRRGTVRSLHRPRALLVGGMFYSSSMESVFVSTPLMEASDGYLGAVWLVLVAVLWGGTNPFLKREGAGIECVKQRNVLMQFVFEMKHLFLNWKYLLAFLINQSGSVIYYLTLASADLSLVAPITNSLTFIITTLTGKMLGERIGGSETYIGMGLVIAGVTVCLMDKT